MKLTPWFPGTIKPVRVGVYERDYGILNMPVKVYSKWDGRKWRAWQVTVSSADAEYMHSVFQVKPWRGLTKPMGEFAAYDRNSTKEKP